MKKQLDSLDKDTIRQVNSACKEISRNCELLTIVKQDLDTIYRTTRCAMLPITQTPCTRKAYRPGHSCISIALMRKQPDSLGRGLFTQVDSLCEKGFCNSDHAADHCEAGP